MLTRRRFFASLGAISAIASPAMALINPFTWTCVIESITPKVYDGFTTVNGIVVPYTALEMEVKGTHFQVKKSQLNFEIVDQFGIPIKNFGISSACYYATSVADGLQPFKVDMQVRTADNMVVNFPFGNWKVLLTLHAPFRTVQANAEAAFRIE